jgi:hypothetical protein
MRMTLAAEKTFAVGGIRIPDTALTRQITSLSGTLGLRSFSTTRVASITGVRLRESTMV